MDTIYSNKFKEYSINTGNNNDLGCDTRTLEKYESTVQDMIDNHSKVLQVRFDLRYPNDNSVTQTPKHIYNFNYNFKRNLNSSTTNKNHKVDAHLIYVKEQTSSDTPHYHYVLLVNGNAKQKYFPLLKKAEHYWSKAIGNDQQGLVHYCDDIKNGIMIHRNSPDFKAQLDECFYQASYLAKTRGKEQRAKGEWYAGGSRTTSKDNNNE